MGYDITDPAHFFEEILGIYYQYNPKTEQTAWLMGYDIYVQLTRMQYSSGQYVLSLDYMVREKQEVLLMGLPIDRTDTPSEVRLYERPVAYTGKTVPLDTCPVCGHPIITGKDRSILCDRSHFKLEGWP